MSDDSNVTAEPWTRRGKGSNSTPFADKARSGNCWYVDPVKNEAHQISRQAYDNTNLPKYNDGHPRVNCHRHENLQPRQCTA